MRQGLGHRNRHPAIARRFLLAFVPAAASVTTLGWLTGLREVMLTTLVAGLTVALLPFVLIAALCALTTAWYVLLALASVVGGEALDDGAGGADGASGLAEAFLYMAGPYYRWLGRIRHPAGWGLAAGAFAGGLLLWGLLGLFVMPRELATVERLAREQERIEAYRRARGSFPEADAEGSPRFDDGASAALDGFGRPFAYRREGRRPFDAYTLRSPGFDGRPSADDLCVEGSSTLGRLAPHVAALLERLASRPQTGLEATKTSLGALHRLRCGAPTVGH